MQAARKVKAASGDAVVKSSPATALAAKLPNDCTVARAPNAEPRICIGARLATAAFSAVSANPIPSPARAKKSASSAIVGPLSAKPRKAAAKLAAPIVSTSKLPRRSPRRPPGMLAAAATTL